MTKIWCTLQRFVISVLVVFVLVQIIFVHLSSSNIFSSLTPPSSDEVNNAWEKDQKIYFPEKSVAWAIPCGGRTIRTKQLSDILNNLVSSGARTENIYIFEDDGGRVDRLPNADVRRIAEIFQVNFVTSGIQRHEHESSHNFGTYLARHYHFMLDYIFINDDGLYEHDVSSMEGRKKIYEFIVILEDDLKLATDTVKFFHEFSRVMRTDETLYCVCAHQDNAFHAITSDTDAPCDGDLNFDFRRGNHFMAPGWMTSANVYKNIVRPKWLDANGNYMYSKQLGLKNGHWDRFWDTLIGENECIFPRIPRVFHMPGQGFTVAANGQAELYSNIKLSTLLPSESYGDIKRMSYPGYEKVIKMFIKSSKRLRSYDAIMLYRNTKITLIVDAKHDQDPEWNNVMVNYFGLIGIGGYGGNSKYAKLRGVHHGSVFLNWCTNNVLLVASYSPYNELVLSIPTIPPMTMIQSLGCYEDGNERDLPHFLGKKTLEGCVDSCGALGFKFAALQDKYECWCGKKYGRYKKKPFQMCKKNCGKPDLACGGPYLNAIYSATDFSIFNGANTMHFPEPPRHTHYYIANKGKSCDDTCISYGLVCDVHLFPLIHSNCPLLKYFFKCDACRETNDITSRIASPGYENLPKNQICTLGRGKDLRCDTIHPKRDFQRLCVCT